jgi:hypothetical protein
MNNYKIKYFKYKEKYLNLKKQLGGTHENFSIVSFESGTIFYHGSFNKITGTLYSPAYYSTDPLQSIGHLLSTSTKIDNTSTSNTDLNKISTCYPIIYKYTVKSQIKLLKMIVGSKSYSRSFEILLNRVILKKYLDLLTNKDTILNNFKNKLYLIGSFIYNSDVTEEIYERKSFEEKWDYLFNIYNKKCENECFGGWANTPGYYIISSIDYNAYLREIMPDIMNDNTVDGIYVENDQNEIILFNNNKFNSEYSKQYILPFSFKDKNKEEITSFITNYISACDLYLSDKTNQENKDNLSSIFKQFNHIDDVHKWNFDWFKVFCKDFDPYTNINPETCTQVNQKDKLKCTKRFPINSDNLNLIYDPDEVECSDDYELLSSKLSIINIDEHSKLLREWIDMILSPKFSDNNLNMLSSICLDRTAQINRDLLKN